MLAESVPGTGVPSDGIEVIGNGVVLDDYDAGIPTDAARSAWGFDDRHSRIYGFCPGMAWSRPDHCDQQGIRIWGTL